MPTNSPSYGAEQAVTITLAGLASSSSLLAGQSGLAISNTTTKAIDYLVSGKISVGTSPTAGTQIIVYALSTVGTSDAWPDVFAGTDAAKTVSSAGVGQGFLKRVATLNVDAGTSNVAYPFGKVSLAALFNSFVVPHIFGFFVTHNTVAALNATAGNHYIVVEPINTAS